MAEKTPNKKGRPAGGKSVAIERRKRVAQMVSAGFTDSDIASIMHISRNTVAKDKKVTEEESRQRVSAIDRFSELGDALKTYKEIEEKALKDHMLAIAPDEVKTRNECLKLAMSARTERTRLAFEAGLIQKINVASDGVMLVEKIAGLTDEELKRREKEILENLGLVKKETPSNVLDQTYDKTWEKKIEKYHEGEKAESENDYFFPEIPKEEGIETAMQVFNKDEIKKITGSANIEDIEEPNTKSDGK